MEQQIRRRSPEERAADLKRRLSLTDYEASVMERLVDMTDHNGAYAVCIRNFSPSCYKFSKGETIEMLEQTLCILANKGFLYRPNYTEEDMQDEVYYSVNYEFYNKFLNTAQ